MKDTMIAERPRGMEIDVAGFEIDAFGRYDVTDPEMLDIVAGGWGGGGNSGNGACQQNGNCGCNN